VSGSRLRREGDEERVDVPGDLGWTRVRVGKVVAGPETSRNCRDQNYGRERYP